MPKKTFKAARATSETGQRYITISGAREHNLKNISVRIPKDTLTVITGPSGSGKSSLALDILYTEGKRRYMESLSSYARQFLGVPKKPDFDHIDGLCPAIAIEQKTVGHNPRSTVGTITEGYDYLRILFARVGVVHCPTCSAPVSQQSPESVTTMLRENFPGKTLVIGAPVIIEKKGEFTHQLIDYFEQGYYRFTIDGQAYRFTTSDEIKKLNLKKTNKHTIAIAIDAVEACAEEQSRLQEGIEKACALAGGTCTITVDGMTSSYSQNHMCIPCAQSLPDLEPRMFSFNSPLGACKDCQGLGVTSFVPWYGSQGHSSDDDVFSDHRFMRTCGSCNGQRLNKNALAVRVGGKNIFELCQLSVKELHAFCESLSFPEGTALIAQPLVKEIQNRLKFLIDVGLGYLSFNRSARTLSGGEGQRIRLATQIGSALSGVLYVLDEPSIGLHQRDNDRLIDTLKKLRDQGNTVVVVEHDLDTMYQSDYLIDMGPGAGTRGGMITAYGTPEELQNDPNSLTGSFLSGKRSIALPEQPRTPKGYLTLSDANTNNLKNLNVRFPLGVVCGVSGVSGSGKSTLVMQELVPALAEGIEMSPSKPYTIPNLSGYETLHHLVVIDQSPIGRTPRSNPATYLGIFDGIRKLFASLPASNARGYTIGRFSFNVAEGRCFECRGDGSITVSMHFLPEVTMICKSCKGKRYNSETLSITYKGKNIADVLSMTAFEALSFFEAHAPIAKRLQLLCDVGLEYLQLGQPSTTLSGGEAQRIKLVDELAKRGMHTMYILDEPTTGLHSSDVERLLVVLNRLVDKGNSMIIIEHNLDVLKTADYIIDMGPEGGDEGGIVVATGTPAQVAASAESQTGYYLRPLVQPMIGKVGKQKLSKQL